MEDYSESDDAESLYWIVRKVRSVFQFQAIQKNVFSFLRASFSVNVRTVPFDNFSPSVW